MHRLYLSRKNLRTLLDKLDRGCAQAAIMKNDVTHRQYPTTVPTLVIALEDDIYYVGRLPLEETTPATPVIEELTPTSGPSRRKKS
jgi:hypothetical protein